MNGFGFIRDGKIGMNISINKNWIQKFDLELKSYISMGL